MSLLARAGHHIVKGGVVGSAFSDFESGAFSHFKRGEDAVLATPVMPRGLVGIFLEHVYYLLAEEPLKNGFFVVRELDIVALEYHLRQF